MRSLWGMGRHPPFLLAFKKMRKKKGGLPIPQRGIGASTLFIPNDNEIDSAAVGGGRGHC